MPLSRYLGENNQDHAILQLEEKIFSVRNDLAETFQNYNLMLKCGTREIYCWRQLSYI